MFKKIFSLSVLLISLNTGFSQGQNFNWITPNKTYLKLYVINNGITRITRPDFVNAGIDPVSVDPRTVKVLFKGNQIPIYFSGEQDGVFNAVIILIFTVTRNYGGLTNTYNQTNTLVYTTDEYFNQYSDTSVYWVDWGGASGSRLTNSNLSTSVLYPSDSYFQSLHFEKDLQYYQGENISGQDTRYLNTERFRGEGWYWTTLSNGQSVSDTFSIPGLNVSGPDASIRVFAYPRNGDASITNEHSIEVRVNGNLAGTLYSNNNTTFDLNRIDTTISFRSSFLSSFSVNTVTLKYVSASGFNGLMLFDLFEVSYPKSFKLLNNKLSADLNSADTTSKLFRLTGYNTLNTINIYDFNNNARITNFANVNDTLIFTAKSNAKLEVVNDTVRNKPSRIIPRQVPDLVSTSNGADYLLVYNQLFAAQTEQLRAYRESRDNYRAVKTEIQDIYDIFNYGMEDPIALKHFVKYVYDNWQLPKLEYVCLLGRGSLDPKRNSPNSSYYQNYIPVYGNPNSDGYFSNFNVGSFFYYDMVSIGRLPAYTPSEAQTMVDKIIAYENTSSAEWWKTFSYVTGGATFQEQQSYQQRSNFEINQYILPTPISGKAVKIYRSDTSGSSTFNYADSIRHTINRGTVFLNFRGHAGSHDWEVGMSDPIVLNNGNKLPVVLSMTCFTGENAKSEFRGFGEKFMYYGGKGAIGFVSTTGWSYEASGNDFGTYIIQSIRNDSARKIGNFVKKAGKSMSQDSLSFAVRHTVNCYKLLGDPAVKIKLPKYPEFVITNNDYKLSTESIVLNEPVTLKITPKNFGLYADTCKIRYQLKKNSADYLVRDTLYRGFKFLDTLLYTFKVDTPGVYTMTVILDQDNRFPDEDETNNTITFNIPYNEYSYLAVKPVNNSVIYKDSVEFSGLNPILDPGQNGVKIVLQLDTSVNFNSPVLQTFFSKSITGTDTRFRAALPVSVNNTIYFWRTNSIINNDSTGWTKTLNFIYNNGNVTQRNNIAKGDELDGFIFANTLLTISKQNPNQFSESDLYDVSYNDNGFKLNEYDASLFIRSYGSNAEEASYFSIGNKNIYIDGGMNTGLNLIKVKRLNGNILDFKNYKMTSSASSDSLITFLNTFDSTHFLMLLNAAYVAGGTTLTTNAKAKLRQFGSVFCDSISILGYFHTWSLIGYLGAPQSEVSEMYDPCCRTSPNCTACDHWTQSTSSKIVTFRKTSGTISNVIGPSKKWTDFYWEPLVPINSSLEFDIIGIDYSGNQTLLRQDLATNKFVELSTIDAKEYPYLNFIAKLKIDTLIGTESPVLKNMKVSYSPAAELVLDRNTLSINSSSKDNSVTNFSFDYHNSGYAYIQGIIVNVFDGDISDSTILLTDTVTSLIKIDSTKSYSNSFTKSQNRGVNSVFISIKPLDLANEFYTFNNTAEIQISSAGTVASAKIEVYR